MADYSVNPVCMQVYTNQKDLITNWFPCMQIKKITMSQLLTQVTDFYDQRKS